MQGNHYINHYIIHYANSKNISNQKKIKEDSNAVYSPPPVPPAANATTEIFIYRLH